MLRCGSPRPEAPFHWGRPAFSLQLTVVSALSVLSHSSGSAPLAATPPVVPSSLTPTVQGLPTSVNLLLAGTAPDQSLQHHT